MNSDGPIQLLDRVYDVITGFTGTATARCEYAYGTAQVQVTASPEVGDPSPGNSHNGVDQPEIKSEWFEEYRLGVLERADPGEVGPE